MEKFYNYLQDGLQVTASVSFLLEWHTNNMKA